MKLNAAEEVESVLVALIRAHEQPIIRYLGILLGDDDLKNRYLHIVDRVTTEPIAASSAPEWRPMTPAV